MSIYIGNYIKKLQDNLEKKVLRGNDIIELTSSKQLNLFILKNIYDAWNKNFEKNKIIYFNYENKEILSAFTSLKNILSNHIEVDIENLKDFGMGIGVAFQMVDDLLDLTGDLSMGKPRGTDVHEGEMTLPLIHALTVLHGTPRQRISEILESFNDALWDELTELLHEAGSFEYTRNLIETHLINALDKLRKLPPSQARELMEGLAEISLGRKV